MPHNKHQRKGMTRTDLAERPKNKREKTAQDSSDEKASQLLGAKVIPENPPSPPPKTPPPTPPKGTPVLPSQVFTSAAQTATRQLHSAQGSSSVPGGNAGQQSSIHPALRAPTGSSIATPGTSSATHPDGRRRSISFEAADWRYVARLKSLSWSDGVQSTNNTP